MGEVDYGEVLRRLEPLVLRRLVSGRASIDPAYARISDEMAARQFASVLVRMCEFLDSGDLEPYRRFASRWVAMRAGQGFTREGAIHSIVAIGDTIVAVARDELTPGYPCDGFVRAVTRMSYLAARMLVDGIAVDIENAEASLREGTVA